MNQGSVDKLDLPLPTLEKQDKKINRNLSFFNYIDIASSPVKSGKLKQPLSIKAAGYAHTFINRNTDLDPATYLLHK